MKHLVAIVDANDRHRNEVEEALLSFYTVHFYDNATSAIAGMRGAAPKLILVGQHVGSESGASFIRDLRKEEKLGEIPVIFIADNGDFRTVDLLRELGIKDIIAKPYHRSALVNAISRQLNGRIEQAWKTLPHVQRKALEGSLSCFNSMADNVSTGTPLPYKAISDACASIVDVVNNGDMGSLLAQIKEHDNFTYVHSLRVSTFMAMFGKAIGLPQEQQVLVASGGMLHDIGKMTIPRLLLNKQGTLTQPEWAVMRSHVDTAEKMLATSDATPKGVVMIVTHHHERLDGSGYPHGLKAEALNRLARMAAIIDVFCALTDRRPYRRMVKTHEALQTMSTEMNSQIDQHLLYRFREVLLDTAPSHEEAGPAALIRARIRQRMAQAGSA